MPNRNQNNVSNLNQGVDYMSQNQQPVNPGMHPQQPMMQQPVNPGVQQPVNPGTQQPVNPGAQQPIVNTTALKAQAGNLANNAKAGVNNLIGKVKGDKKNMVIAIVAVVVVALVLVMGGANFLSPSASIVNKYMSGMKSGNAKKIAKLYHKDIIENRYDGDIDDLIDELEEEFEEQEDEDYKILSYKVRECEKFSEDELEDLAETFETLFDIDEDDIKAARKYFVRVTVDNDGEKNIGYQSVTVVKIGNKWSLYY